MIGWIIFCRKHCIYYNNILIIYYCYKLLSQCGLILYSVVNTFSSNYYTDINSQYYIMKHNVLKIASNICSLIIDIKVTSSLLTKIVVLHLNI